MYIQCSDSILVCLVDAVAVFEVYIFRTGHSPGRNNFNPGTARNCPGVATPLVTLKVEWALRMCDSL